MRFCARCANCRWFWEANAAPTCGRISSQRGWAPPTEAALVFHMLCMFGQLSPLLGDLKISLLRTGIACTRPLRAGQKLTSAGPAAEQSAHCRRFICRSSRWKA